MSRQRNSIEDITALPVSLKLQQSPHLRHVDIEKPPIPYNFREHAESQSSVQRQQLPSSRPQTPRSKRGAYDSTPQRRRSNKKRKDDHLREEEIRAMSAPIPIPRRPGDLPLSRDGSKRRTFSYKDSQVSLPPDESVHSMASITEQRGWEVGSLGIFSPRPAIRLSGTPQYASPGAYLQSPLSRDNSSRAKDKAPVTKDAMRKRQTIGREADDLDSSDIRLLMDRDAKRREQRKREQQEKLDRKLRARAGRNRGDSDRRKREAEEARKAEEVRQTEAMRREAEQADSRRLEAEQAESMRREVEQEESMRRQGELLTPPTDLHPALCEEPVLDEAETVGLGIGATQATTVRPFEADDQLEQAVPTTEAQGSVNTGTYLNYPPGRNIPENPFEDPAPAPASSPEHEERLALPGAFTPLATPKEDLTEDPMISTAQAIRMSRTSTPPLSPVHSPRSASRVSNLTDQSRQDRAASRVSNLTDQLRQDRTASLPEPPPIIPAALAERRTSEPKERRAGAWATFFRRGGTNLKKPDDGRQSPSEFSFSNTSRESMSRQPMPAHLIGEPVVRSKSGTPTRTQSKFREDLPEMPMSPPDSRVQSPDIAMSAGAAAAARRARRSPMPMDIPEGVVTEDSAPDPTSTQRYDTPTSPSQRGHGLMSGSMASVDSEGSWLASGSQKRASTQSALSRGKGSLSKRKPEFAASYEELGGDKDAEYFQNMSPSPESRRALQSGRRISSPAHTGASPDEESEHGEADRPESSETPLKPLQVHESVRRQPTLVHRDPRLKSREAMLAEYASGEESPEYSPIETESPETRMQKATSVNYGKGHARQVSVGSARLLDITPSKKSMDFASTDSRPSSMPPISKL